MVEWNADVADIGKDVGVAPDGRAGYEFRPEGEVGDAGPGLAHTFEGCNCDLDVDVGRIAQPGHVEDWGGGDMRTGDGNVASGYRGREGGFDEP